MDGSSSNGWNTKESFLSKHLSATNESIIFIQKNSLIIVNLPQGKNF